MLILLPLVVYAVRWPLGDGATPHPIANFYGELQVWDIMLHTGVDIVGDGKGDSVYAVAAGVVKGNDLSGFDCCLKIADSLTNDSCNGWAYAHLDPDQYHKDIGDWVEEGELIGHLLGGPSFPHVHLSRIRGAGEIWDGEYMFIDNPAVDLEPSGDTVAPVFEEVFENQLFGFKANNAEAWETYLSSDSLYGDVDVIARIHDKTGIYWEDCPDSFWARLAPMEAWIEIHGLRSTYPVRSFLFDGHLQYNLNMETVYTRDSTFISTPSNFYFNLTNTDGDSLREESDYDSCWHTGDFPDGNYWVVVTAKDAADNTTTDSMQVTLANGVGIAESPDVVPASFELLTPVVSKGSPLIVLCQAEGVLPVLRVLRVRVYDVSGREQIATEVESSPHPQEIQIAELPRGVYYLKIEYPSVTFKFIIVR